MTTCADIRRLADTNAPEAEVLAHFAACAVCRGALTLLCLDILGFDEAPPVMDCEACVAALPAYAEWRDSPEAMVAYPAVWWHLWACERCAAVYAAVRALLTAEVPQSSVTGSIHDRH